MSIKVDPNFATTAVPSQTPAVDPPKRAQSGKPLLDAGDVLADSSPAGLIPSTKTASALTAGPGSDGTVYEKVQLEDPTAQQSFDAAIGRLVSAAEHMRPGDAPSPEAIQAAQVAMETYTQATGTQSVDEVQASVLGATIALRENEVAELAYDLDAKNKARESLRTEVAELADMLEDWPEGAVEEFTYTHATFNDDDTINVSNKTESLTRQGAEELKERLGKDREEIAGMTAFQQQVLLQKSNDIRELYSTLSEILANAHKSVQNSIGNIK